MIKNILFDLDDTILDFRKAEKIALAKMLIHFGYEPTEQALADYSIINLSQWKLFELKQLTLEQVKTRRYELFFKKYGLDIDPTEATAYYEKMLGIGHYFVDGAFEALQRLCGKYNLYIASNGTPQVQHNRIASADIEKYLKGIFISNEIGVAKPNKGFFDYCFAHMEDFSKENTVIIGDSLSSDIKGGIESGIKTVWFNPKGSDNDTEYAPNYEIKSLYELDDVLMS